MKLRQQKRSIIGFNRLVLFFLLVWSPFGAIAQIKYTGRAEYSAMQYIGTLVKYETDRSDPYYLDERVNGMEINFVNGIILREKGMIGLGVSYLNFDKIKGLATTLDFEYLPSKRKLSPVLNFRYGRSYLKNQYDVRKSSAIGGADIGLNYKSGKLIQVFVKGGVAFLHNTGFFTWRGGLRF